MENHGYMLEKIQVSPAFLAPTWEYLGTETMSLFDDNFGQFHGRHIVLTFEQVRGWFEHIPKLSNYLKLGQSSC